MTTKFTKELLGAELYSRNNSTGKPTQYHIIKAGTFRTYCGFSHPFCEHDTVDETHSFLENEFCKKCLKSYRKEVREIGYYSHTKNCNLF